MIELRLVRDTVKGFRYTGYGILTRGCGPKEVTGQDNSAVLAKHDARITLRSSKPETRQTNRDTSGKQCDWRSRENKNELRYQCREHFLRYSSG